MLGRMRRLFIKRFLPILFWFCLLLGTLVVYREVTPRVQGDYLILDEVKRELSMPLRILAEGSHLIFGMYLETGARFPGRYVLASSLFILFAIAGLAVTLFPYFPRWGVELHLIFVGGVLLRTFYTLQTHFSERGPDWLGHLQYIQYVSEHWRIPPWEMGWEAYQPPFYYFVGAIWLRLADLILPFHEAISSLQILSL